MRYSMAETGKEIPAVRKSNANSDLFMTVLLDECAASGLGCLFLLDTRRVHRFEIDRLQDDRRKPGASHRLRDDFANIGKRMFGQAIDNRGSRLSSGMLRMRNNPDWPASTRNTFFSPILALTVAVRVTS